MIRLFLLLLLSVFKHGTLEAQVTFRLADSASWQSKTVGYDSPGGWYVSTSIAVLNSDSIFHNGFYWKLYNGEMGDVYVLSVEDKVWVTQVQNSVFDLDSTYLLYDFGLSVGDTAHTIYQFNQGGSPNNFLILNSINDTILNGKTLKVYKFNEDIWIENIGSMKGFLNPIYEYVPLGGVFSLCSYQGFYTDSSSSLFELQLYYPVTCMLSANEIKNNEWSYYVANEYLYINGVEEEVRYAIYSLQGAIKQVGFITGNNFKLSIQSLSAGFYLVQVGEKHFTFVK